LITQNFSLETPVFTLAEALLYHKDAQQTGKTFCHAA